LFEFPVGRTLVYVTDPIRIEARQRPRIFVRGRHHGTVCLRKGYDGW
jgi:hypothetical protein